MPTKRPARGRTPGAGHRPTVGRRARRGGLLSGDQATPVSRDPLARPRSMRSGVPPLDQVAATGVGDCTGIATVPRASTASGPSGPSAGAVSSGLRRAVDRVAGTVGRVADQTSSGRRTGATSRRSTGTSNVAMGFPADGVPDRQLPTVVIAATRWPSSVAPRSARPGAGESVAAPSPVDTTSPDRRGDDGPVGGGGRTGGEQRPPVAVSGGRRRRDRPSRSGPVPATPPGLVPPRSPAAPARPSLTWGDAASAAAAARCNQPRRPASRRRRCRRRIWRAAGRPARAVDPRPYRGTPRHWPSRCPQAGPLVPKLCTGNRH